VHLQLLNFSGGYTIGLPWKRIEEAKDKQGYSSGGNGDNGGEKEIRKGRTMKRREMEE
jgi:hypothetical protein